MRLEQSAEPEPVVVHFRDATAERLDGFPRRARHARHLDVDFSGESFRHGFAVGIRRKLGVSVFVPRRLERLELREQFHAVPHSSVHQTGIHEVLHGERLGGVQAPVVDPPLQLLEVERRERHAFGVHEAPLRERQTQRGLATLEPDSKRRSAPALLAVIPAPGGLALARATTAPHANRVAASAGHVAQIVQREHALRGDGRAGGDHQAAAGVVPGTLPALARAGGGERPGRRGVRRAPRGRARTQAREAAQPGRCARGTARPRRGGGPDRFRARSVGDRAGPGPSRRAARRSPGRAARADRVERRAEAPRRADGRGPRHHDHARGELRAIEDDSQRQGHPRSERLRVSRADDRDPQPFSRVVVVNLHASRRSGQRQRRDGVRRRARRDALARVRCPSTHRARVSRRAPPPRRRRARTGRASPTRGARIVFFSPEGPKPPRFRASRSPRPDPDSRRRGGRARAHRSRGQPGAVHRALDVRVARRVRGQDRRRPRALRSGLRDGFRRALRQRGRFAGAGAALRRRTDRDRLARHAFVAVRRGPESGVKSDGVTQRGFFSRQLRRRARVVRRVLRIIRSDALRRRREQRRRVEVSRRSGREERGRGHELRRGLRHARCLARRVQRGHSRG